MNALTSRIIGFGTSLLLTLAAYLIILRPEFIPLTVNASVVAILILALLQGIAQYFFFLQLPREGEGPPFNQAVFISTLGIIFIIIFFSIWIMNNLNYRMMP